jgi:hypothetical protein
LIIYRFETSSSAADLACVREGEYRRVWELGAGPIAAADWAPLNVKMVRDGLGSITPTDVMLLGTEPAFSARAVEALASIVFKHGQILPLRSADGEFYLWSVTRAVEALDVTASTLKRFTDGGIMSVSRWAFLASVIRDLEAFKVPPFLRANVFVNQAFVERAQAAGLSGFAPRRVWQEQQSSCVPVA